MIPRRVSVLEVSLVGGALALVGVALVLLRPGAPAESPAPAPGAARDARGVQGEAWDSARREAPPAEAAARAAPSLPQPLAPRPDLPAADPVPPGVDSPTVDESAAIRALHPQVIASVSATFEANRTRLRNACFKGQPVRLRVEASFDPEGRLLVLSIPDDPKNPAASSCVRDQRLALAVDPPGRHVTVEVPLALP